MRTCGRWPELQSSGAHQPSNGVHALTPPFSDEPALHQGASRELAQFLHIVPQLVREPDRSVGRTNDPYGGDFLEQLAGTPERTLKARLKAISEALRVAVPQLSELELQRDARGAPHLRGRYEHWRPQGAWQNEDQFSDGTLRLLGLLWAIVDNTGPLLLEEPELSLHPEVVRFLPQMFARMQRRSGRQIVTSTHSSDLLRDEGIGLDEVLLLTPGPEGTVVRTAAAFRDVRDLLSGGSTLAEAVMPLTRQRALPDYYVLANHATVRRRPSSRPTMGR